MERFDLRLDAVLLGDPAILLQLFAIVNSVKLNRRVVGIGLETFIVGVEADGHHVRFLFHQLQPLREPAVGDSILDDRLDFGSDQVLQTLPAWNV
jgi:hypothetical protein